MSDRGDPAGQYFAMERYFLQQERISPLRRRCAGILPRLNCCFDMAASPDVCASKLRAPAAAEGLFIRSAPRE